MSNRSIALSLAGLGLGLLSATAADAQTVSFNFIGPGYTAGSTSYSNLDNNIDPAASTGAHSVGDWNNDSGGSTADTLNQNYDSNASLTSITFVANGATSQSNKLEANDPNSFSSSPNYQLMDGYLQSSLTTPDAVTVGNVPYSKYDLYVYFFNGTAATDSYTFTPGTTTTVNGITTFIPSGVGTTISALSSATFGGTFVQATGTTAGDYIVFSGLSGSTFQLTTATGTAGVPINGLQIVAAAPEPSAWAGMILGAGALGVLAARRRKAGDPA